MSPPEASRKTILVLGATGTVGRALATQLVQQHQTVRAATRSVDDYGGAGTAVVFDFGDQTTWRPALEGVDRLFVLAPPGHADQYGLLHPFLETAFASGTLARVVTMTAQGVDASDAIPFRRLEVFIEESGVDFVHLRPTWFSQNFHTFWGQGIREANVIALPAREARVAFIDARDIAAAAAAALTRGDIDTRRAYELTGPEALTYGEAAAILSREVGQSIAYRSIDDAAFRDQLAPSGLPADYIELLVGLFAAVRAGVAAPTTDAVEVLSGRPPRPLADYARAHAELLR